MKLILVITDSVVSHGYPLSELQCQREDNLIIQKTAFILLVEKENEVTQV